MYESLPVISLPSIGYLYSCKRYFSEKYITKNVGSAYNLENITKNSPKGYHIALTRGAPFRWMRDLQFLIKTGDTTPGRGLMT